MQSRKMGLRSLQYLGHFLASVVLLLTGWFWSAPIVVAQDQSGITSPAAGATVSGDVPIMGTAVIEPFQKYELAYKLEPSGNDAYIYFGGGTSPVVNGQLNIWSTSGLAPGTYSLRLRVVKTDGNYDEKFATNLIVNQQAATPTATATSSEPTATPIPTTTFTPAPPPIANVGQVAQPAVEGEQPLSTPTVAVAVAAGTDGGQSGDTTGGVAVDGGAAAPVAVAGSNVAVDTTNTSDEATDSLGRDLGEALSLDRLRTRFVGGVRLSAALALAAFAIFAGKRIFSWAWTRYR